MRGSGQEGGTDYKTMYLPFTLEGMGPYIVLTYDVPKV